jgi:hypothetical protein
MFKRVLIVAVAVALAVPLGLLAVSALGRAAPAAQAQTPTPEPVNNPARTITVIGQATVHVVPDVANVSIGVETRAATVADATQENQTKMKALMAALKQAGIADKDIQTSNYSISWNQPQPIVSPAPEIAPGQTVTGTTYTVSNMVNVTVRDLNAISEVLDTATAAGANSIWGVSFGMDKPDVPLADARTQAVADARTRAQALADLGGVKLGPVMSMSEVMSGGPIPVAMPFAAKEAAAGATPISPGEVEVSYQVQVVYFIGE